MEQQTNQNKKAKFRLPFSAVLLYLALIAAALSGVTFSRYVTGTTVSDSARVAMMKELTVTETEMPDGSDQRVILPGVDITKQAVVDFEGSEMACYVFCAITANGWTRTDNFHYTAGNGLLNWAVDNTKWIFLQGDGSTSVYYCIVNANTVLHADVLAEDGKITVSENITRSQLDALAASAAPLSIKISATAVQYHGFSEGLQAEYTEADRAEAAWNAVKGK
ncbi:MAG: hypothetical protein ACLVGP_07280 [Oscillospiraceae bacterium]